MIFKKTINNMPRKIHDYFSTDELFFNLNYRDEPWKEIPKENLFIFVVKEKEFQTLVEIHFLKNEINQFFQIF